MFMCWILDNLLLVTQLYKKRGNCRPRVYTRQSGKDTLKMSLGKKLYKSCNRLYIRKEW